MGHGMRLSAIILLCSFRFAYFAMSPSLLDQPKSLLEQMINNALDAFVVIDESSTVIAWSRRAEQLFGWSAQEAVGRVISDLVIPPTLRDAHHEGMRRFRNTGERHVIGQRVEISAQHRDGNIFPVELSVTELEVDGRRLFGAALRDITERLEIEEQFCGTFEQAAVGIAHITLERKVLRVNQKLCEIVGYSKEELLSIPSQMLTHPEDQGVETPHLEDLLAGRATSSTYEKRFKRKDGKVIWVQITLSLLRSASREPKYFIGVLEDITERKRIQEEATRLAAVIEATPDFVGFATTEGDALYANPAGRQMVGLSPEQRLQGASILNKYPPSMRQRVQEGIQTAIKQGTWRGEAAILAADGTEIPVSQVIIAHRSQNGKVEYVSTILRDISHRKQQEDALRAADQRKDEFLAMLAHELRNPLAPIVTAATVLKLSKFDEDRVQHTSEIIARQTKHMSELLDDLLDVSRVTRGLITLSNETLELNGIVADAIEQARPGIEEKRHELFIRPADRKIWIEGDRTRLVQVIANLLTNASRYTPEGGKITVNIESHKRTASVIIQDNGIGIEPELLPQVFELFVQGKQSSDRAEGGLGVGLALVKNLVEMHGGKVSAKSEGHGKGSEFIVSFPVTANAGNIPQIENRVRATEKKTGRIMIVDDNKDAASTLAMLLEYEGYQVRVAHDGNEAIEQAKMEQPDVLLVDIGLPGMDGYEFARRLRKMPQTARSVFIAVTGYGTPGDMENSKRAGFDHHLLKPVNADRLIALLNAS
jgi:PAS domain S-box-containing protein